MKEIINEYKSKFDKLLSIIDFGSPEKKRDIAFAMVLEIVKARDVWRDSRKLILFELALYAVGNEKIINNLIREVSSETSVSIDYSAYKNVMNFMSQESFFNLKTVRYIHDHMHAEYLKYRGGSSMQDQVYQVDFNGINSMVLGKCLEILEMANNEKLS